MSLTTLERANSKAETSVVSLEVKQVRGSDKVLLPRVFTRTQLPINIEHMATPTDIRQWSHLKDLQIPPVDVKDVTMLIGQDNPTVLLPHEVRHGCLNEPYAVKTILGWAISGPMPMDNCQARTKEPKVTSNFLTLEDQVAKFWKIEDIDDLTDEKAMSYNDKKTLSMWEETLQQNEDRHYEVSIPFRKRPPTLSNNLQIAQQRLGNLQKKLTKDPVLKQNYCCYMKDLLECGYAEKTPFSTEQNDMPTWYLPHHSVINPRKPEKTRVVFDCSAKYKGTSLNEQVYQGPDLTNSLLGVLLRFREEPVAIMADIQSMFHQVKVPPSERSVLSFLWWPNGDLSQPAVDHRMTVHLFGGTWCPSICSFVLRHTAEVNQTGCDESVVETVKKNFYVDDCLKTLPDVETAVKFIPQLCELLESGGFKLTKWMSNKHEVLESIPVQERAKGVEVNLSQQALPTERALGVYWNVEEDVFCYKIALEEKPLTRRGILSMVSSIFDPLGFASPCILQAKKILQELTRQKLQWDEPIPDQEREKWLEWHSNLKKLEEMKINRCVKFSVDTDIVDHSLHFFSDASETAYGTVAYLRTVCKDRVHCCLLMAKSRLAPIKKVTIPRLELMAATLSVKLNHVILKHIDFRVSESVFWTDSATVLRYITNEGNRYKTFVANRVAVIREGSQPNQWHYVDSKSNPADDVSRGQTADQLLHNKRWKEGPSFLRKNEEQWPSLPGDTLHADNDMALEVKVTSHVTQAQRSEDTAVDKIFHRQSSWYRLKRDVAWWLRFKNWLKAKVQVNASCDSGSLTVDELQRASIEIIKYVQRQAFSEEIAALKKSDPTNAKLRHKNLHRLDPQLSEDGVLVVGGRLNQAPIPHDARHQMILPRHHIADLLIRQFHIDSGHSGREYVLSMTREQFWILGARTAIRRVINDCFTCRKRQSPCSTQKMADLPASRVTPGNPPFTYTGVDYFGPFHVKQGRKLMKRYGCIFTCLTIRAIHIEIAHSLDTSSFINALQRFISRRGMPKEISSDNGTNFTGADRELKEAVQGWNQTKLGEFFRQREIKWNFNPPAASHMGGSWERQIRTIRKVLSGVMREQTLDDEGLSTLMCTVESIVNSRPLTYVSDDPRDPEPLSPNHLLLLRSGPTLPPGRFQKEDMYSRKRWRHIQYLADLFWKRWVREYLPLLQSRQKWMTVRRDIQIGDVVLIADNNTPRNMWQIATVIKTFPGRDGHVRSAEVQTVNTTLIRPITKLCLLEEVTECRTV
ncbi:uncharacterized protein LOC106179805 [Lingula anatina]|uniref:Uncharacterized protein LOC106179805 n=1 Tax=Lingula anatina TaxID=7574 RepID=A0A1S3K952_LINAN|nr:uncharacterized protein LOC106179805 [Lingula anatina]|eukprot:XP_013419027.1 uncharacterized protein LOC106179805 [Lingula anatina]